MSRVEGSPTRVMVESEGMHSHAMRDKGNFMSIPAAQEAEQRWQLLPLECKPVLASHVCRS